jgi:tripartite-type tricarboxylate transporter receptor subunit TctC
MLRMFAAVVCAALSASTIAHAQDSWPERPIKFIVHVAAGGGVDLMARILADRLSQQLPQRITIENMGGAGGAIAARAVAKADPDGYTFLFVGPGHAAIPAMHKQPPYDPIADFAPVSLVTQFPLVVVINPKVPAQNLTEFIALAKANPGKYTFGSSGVGGNSHIPAEMLKHQAGIDITHIPFRGGSQSLVALLGGQIDLVVDGLAPQLPYIADGRTRVLGVTTRERTPYLPGAPAISEVLPGYEYPMWVAVFAPAKTPNSIVNKLSAEIGNAMKDPTTQKRYTDIKVDMVGSTPAQLDTFFRQQIKFNETIIKQANISATE